MGTKKTQIALIKCVRGGSEDQKTRKKPARKWHFLRFEPSAGQYIHTYTYIYIYLNESQTSSSTLLPEVSYCFQQSSDIAKDKHMAQNANHCEDS